MEPRPSSRPKFWLALQPSIVRIYKVAGLIALTAILIGLIGFLVVNVFYFFDHTWVRPVVLSPTHRRWWTRPTSWPTPSCGTARSRPERLEIEAQLAEIDRTITVDDRWIAEVGASVDKPTTQDQWLVRRELEQARLQKDNLSGRRAPLNQRLDSLKLRA